MIAAFHFAATGEIFAAQVVYQVVCGLVKRGCYVIAIVKFIHWFCAKVRLCCSDT